MTPADLGAEVKNHYKYQLLQEVYVLILGLDVLGNPYGLIKDFAHGVSDFFYEPYLVRRIPAEGLWAGILFMVLFVMIACDMN